MKASLGNVNLQFVEAEKTVNRKQLALVSKFFCRLRRYACQTTCRLRDGADRFMTDSSSSY
jgi:hypothetical protein